MTSSMLNNRKKILIIEDDHGLIRTLTNLLIIEGFDVITAHTGEGGIRMAFEEKPDLILADIVLNRISGYDILRMVRASRVTQSVPFIFLSGKVKEKEIRYGLGLGADDYLCKPFEHEDLLEAINAQLENYQIEYTAKEGGDRADGLNTVYHY